MKTQPDVQRWTGAFQDLRKACQEAASELQRLAAEVRNGEFQGPAGGDAGLAALRQDFDTLKSEIVAFAAQYGHGVEPGRITSLATLEPLLVAVNRGRKEGALQILDQVLSLRHREYDVFAPLQACLAEASALRRAVEAVALPDLHLAVGDLADASHPLGALLSLVRERGRLREEEAAARQEVVARAFGNDLFFAAVLGRLALAGEEAPQGTSGFAGAPKAATPEEAPASGEGAPDGMPEQRKILQDLVAMTKIKVRALVEKGWAAPADVQGHVAVLEEMERTVPEKTGVREDFRRLQAVRGALEEIETRAANPGRRPEGQERLRLAALLKG